MNELDAGEHDSEMAARISAYELAFRMQTHAPEAVDLSAESAKTKRAYGLEQDHTRDFGTRLLLARRLVERGVRFLQIYSGGLTTVKGALQQAGNTVPKKGVVRDRATTSRTFAHPCHFAPWFWESPRFCGRVYESEAAYLDRLELLTEEERRIVSSPDYEPYEEYP